MVVNIGARRPATIELAGVALILGSAWSLPFGILSALRRRSILDRLANAVSGLGVSIPEFSLGLILLLVFFGTLEWAPAPLGRTLGDIPPHTTGLYAIDAVLAGDWEAFKAAAVQLILPAVTLAIAVGAQILAALSFIGLGVQLPTPEWCAMVGGGADYTIYGQWWVSLFPGLAILATVLTLNQLSDEIRHGR